jgi:hypothetical protein
VPTRGAPRHARRGAILVAEPGKAAGNHAYNIGMSEQPTPSPDDDALNGDQPGSVPLPEDLLPEGDEDSQAPEPPDTPDAPEGLDVRQMEAQAIAHRSQPAGKTARIGSWIILTILALCLISGLVVIVTRLLR